MNRRSACLLAVVAVLITLTTIGSEISHASTASKRSAHAKLSAQLGTPGPVSNIGFLSAPQIPAGGYDNATYFAPVSGDFNGDGNKDVATVVRTPGAVYQISVALGNGNGTFQAPMQTPLPMTVTGPDPIWAGDVDGDGKDDIVTGHNGTGGAPATFRVWISNGDGRFTWTGTVISLGTPSHITWGTLYKDVTTGFLDVVIADGVNSKIWTATGNNDGSFNAPTSLSFSPKISPNANVAFADFDADGIMDFAATDAVTNQDEVFFGTGTGFNAPVLLQTTDFKYDSCFDAAGDLNNDGKIDLVSAGANCNPADLLQDELTVYINSSDGRFTNVTGMYYPVGIRPEAVTIADVNNDGYKDVISVTTQPGNVRVLLNDGLGDGKLVDAGVPSSIGYATGGNVKTQAIVDDFNNDGKADVMVSDLEFSFIYLEGYGNGDFKSAINYYAQSMHAGFHPNGIGIASGDFNGDGIPDIVTGNYNNSAAGVGITVFLSASNSTNVNGGMVAGTQYNPPGSTELQFVAVADFNKDGKLDVVATNSANLVGCTTQPCAVVEIFTGNGDGSFTQTPATYATGSSGTDTTRSVLGVVVGDFNGDGWPDLAVINNYSGTSADVAILLNDGTGNFVLQPNNLPLSVLATEITAADLNGDGRLDLVVPLYGTAATPGTNVAVLLGNGDGTFKPEADVAVMNNPYAAAIGDLNGDGIPDLAVTIEDQTASPQQGIAVAFGNGDGTFQPAMLLASTLQLPQFDNPNPGYVKMVDMNRDGHLDLVYTNTQFGTVGILYNQGAGTFDPPVEFAAGHRAFDIAVADVNGDGALDVVTTGNAAAFSGINVLLNTSADLVVLKSSSPQSTPGASVNFTATVSGSQVTGVTAQPTGTVSFFDGATQIGSAVPLSSGGAAVSTSSLSIGSHNITARYSGDSNYVPYTSTVLIQAVGLPDYSLSATPGTRTVNPGSAASYTIMLTPAFGYDGAVTITCPSSLPTGVTCNTATIAAGQKQATLTISTAGPTGMMIGAPDVNQHHSDPNLWASLTGVGMLGMVLAGDWKKRNRRLLGVILLIVAVAMIIGLVGCGGGSSGTTGGGGGGGTGGTPAGSYLIKLSATGTAGTNGGSTAAHPLNVTLVVN